MKAVLVCKICAKEVIQADLEKHIKSHDPLNYFDVKPSVEWNK